MLRISILTICPEMFGDFLASHVIVRAREKGLAQVEIIDIRQFAGGSFRHVDDSPYGGGPGMVLRAEPVCKALEAARGQKAAGQQSGDCENVAAGEKVEAQSQKASLPVTEDKMSAEVASEVRHSSSRAIFLSPQGRVFNQKIARELAGEEHLILLCGHYEGIDVRVMPYVDEELSVGDYILTGGEIPAMAVTDAVVRLLKGNLKEGSAEEESFENGLLEYPHYTRPVEFRGQRVPEVLLSGNHEAIAAWRLEESRRITKEKRPEGLR